MPRTLWSGSLSFGLVNVPVQLVSAVRDLDFHFRQLHEKDKAPIEQRRYCAEEDVEVTWEEVAHSYDLDGKQVVVTDEELASVQPRKTRTIDIEGFVDLADVDPIFFDHPYFLVPAGESDSFCGKGKSNQRLSESQQRAVSTGFFTASGFSFDQRSIAALRFRVSSVVMLPLALSHSSSASAS